MPLLKAEDLCLSFTGIGENDVTGSRSIQPKMNMKCTSRRLKIFHKVCLEYKWKTLFKYNQPNIFIYVPPVKQTKFNIHHGYKLIS